MNTLTTLEKHKACEKAHAAFHDACYAFNAANPDLLRPAAGDSWVVQAAYRAAFDADPAIRAAFAVMKATAEAADAADAASKADAANS